MWQKFGISFLLAKKECIEMYERRGGGGRGGFGGGGFGRRPSFERFDKPKPVKIGEEYDVKITDVGAKGDGITKVENFIIFVHGAKKGEECRIRIKEVANKFAIAEKVGASEAGEEPAEESSEKESEEATEETEAAEESSEQSEEESE